MTELDKIIDLTHRKINYNLMKMSYKHQVESWINENKAWDWFTRSFSCIRIHMNGLEFVSMYNDLPNVFIEYSNPDSIKSGLDDIKIKHISRYCSNKVNNNRKCKTLPYCLLPSIRFSLIFLISLFFIQAIGFSNIENLFYKLFFAVISLLTMFATYSSFMSYKWVSSEGKKRYEKAEKEGFNYFTVISKN